MDTLTKCRKLFYCCFVNLLLKRRPLRTQLTFSVWPFYVDVRRWAETASFKASNVVLTAAASSASTSRRILLVEQFLLDVAEKGGSGLLAELASPEALAGLREKEPLPEASIQRRWRNSVSI